MITTASALNFNDLPLKEQAYEKVKKLILNEEIAVNSFLSERRLAEQLGMSKTPVRLAVERLENEGFVRVSPQQGIMVLALSFEDIIDYIDYRRALETFVVKQISSKLNQAQVDLLQANLKEHKDILKQDESASKQENMALIDMAFHTLLFSFQGNKQLSQALGRQQDMMYRVASRVNQRFPKRPKEAHQDHIDITKAIIDGNKDKATTLIDDHITKMKALLIG